MDKCVDTGDQVAQCAGVYYPYPIDNLIKIVLGHKYYGRYCDDFYIICDSKEKLENTLKAIKKACKKLGIFLNLKKTHISPLRCVFNYLEVNSFLIAFFSSSLRTFLFKTSSNVIAPLLISAT